MPEAWHPGVWVEANRGSFASPVKSLGARSERSFSFTHDKGEIGKASSSWTHADNVFTLFRTAVHGNAYGEERFGTAHREAEALLTTQSSASASQDLV